MQIKLGILAVLVALGLIAVPACTSKKPDSGGSSGGKKKTAKDDGDGSEDEDDGDGSDDGSGSDEPAGDDCTAQSGSGADETDSGSDGDSADDEGTELTFHLTAEGTATEVIAVMQDRCISCHKAGGTAPGDYTDINDVVADATRIADRVQDTENPMPPEGSDPLTADEIAAIEAWIDAGKPVDGGSDDSDSGDNDSSSGSSPSDPCDKGSSGTGSDTGSGSDDSDTEPVPDSFKDFVDPPERQACHDKGKVFWRKGDAEHAAGCCHNATRPAQFTCDRAGVLAAFNNNAQVVAALDELEGKGYKYDDCGVLDGKPAVFLMCLHEGDNVCVDYDSLDGDKAAIKATVISSAADQSRVEGCAAD